VLFEGHIETTHSQEISTLQVTFGLDTAGELRLLDQRTAYESKRQVSSPQLFINIFDSLKQIVQTETFLRA
jgi:hypothetical protein